MSEALGRPPLMLIDLRPIRPPMVIVGSHEIAEQISKASKIFPYSLPKMPEGYDHMVHIIGPTSILASDGEEWKKLRKRFNVGFAPQHLITLLPCILEKSFTFLGHLDSFAHTGQSFSFLSLTGNLTFDIITSVVMDFDFGAQNGNQPVGFIRDYQELFQTYTSEQIELPWIFAPRAEWTRRRLARQIRNQLKVIVCDAFANRAEDTTTRSILSLGFQDVNTLTTQAVNEACDQLSTFLFAGHDTTGVLLSCMFYELGCTPHALQAVRDELDSLFGSDTSPSFIREKLLSEAGQDLLQQMTYTAAVVKETLRRWPPAGTARMTKRGAGLRVQTSTGEYLLDGVSIYNCALMIQSDPEVYGDTADEFLPERWQDKTASQIPTSAWRPFERGPRNCIGQELALLEARIVVALVARRYDFTKIGIGELSLDETGNPVLDDKGHFKVVSEMYPVRQITAKPIDGMMMRVKIRELNGKPGAII